MALMKFREANQVKWVGVRPGHNGTFVSAQGMCDAVAWVTFYTVPANKWLFITHSFLTARSAAVLGETSMLVRTEGNDHRIHMLMFDAAANTELAVDTSHPFPIEVSTGGLVRLLISPLGVKCYGGFNGYLIDV